MPVPLQQSIETILPHVVGAFSCDTLRGRVTLPIADTSDVIRRGDFFANPGEFGKFFNDFGLSKIETAVRDLPQRTLPMTPVAVNINGAMKDLTQVACGWLEPEPLVGLRRGAITFLDEAGDMHLSFWLYYEESNLFQPVGHGVEFCDTSLPASITVSSVVPRLNRYSGWQLATTFQDGPGDLDVRFRQHLVDRHLVTPNGQDWSSGGWSSAESTQGESFVVEAPQGRNKAALAATLKLEAEEGLVRPNIAIFYGARGAVVQSGPFSPERLVANPQVFERNFLTQWGEVGP